MRWNKGFSMIELIVVLLLVGITSAVVVPRFLRPGVFNEMAARDALLASIRSAQQAALGRSAVSFTIAAGVDDWEFSALAAGMPIRTLEVSSNGVTLQTGPAGASANTCASTSGFNDPVNNLELLFNNRGDLAQFTNNGTTLAVDDTFNGVRICVNDRVEASVCVSPAGYAYAGNCDD